MNNQSVINAFVCGKSAKSSNGNLKSFGNRLVSYYTTIAQRLDNGTIVLNRTKYSVSTSKIQTWTKVAFYGHRNVVEVTNVPLGTTDLQRYMK
jgi:hypothetical protein